jgi:hypothetical protein
MIQDGRTSILVRGERVNEELLLPARRGVGLSAWRVCGSLQINEPGQVAPQQNSGRSADSTDQMINR